MADQNGHGRPSESHDRCAGVMDIVKFIFNGCKSLFEHLETMLNHEMLMRNTIKLIQQIMKESGQERQTKDNDAIMSS